MKCHITYIIGRLILCMGMVLLLTTCTDDSSVQDREDYDLLQLVGLNTELMTEQTRLTGYTDYGSYTTTVLGRSYESGDISIGVYMVTPPTATTVEKVSALSRFIYLGNQETDKNKWQSMAEVKKGVTYYLYGYMPVEMGGTAKIEKLPNKTSYVDGAKLTLSGISPVSAYDACVVSGIQQVASTSSPEALVAGQYHYEGKEKGQNHVYMMLDHLYASVSIDLKVEVSYAELRTIKLKKMALASTAVEKVNAVLSLAANVPYQVNWEETAGTAESTPFYENKEGLELPTSTTTQPMYGYFVPISNVANSLTLVCIYDVYDKKGNLLRKDCTAANQLSTLFSNLKAGEQQRFHLTVSPTYLYQLSDADLDNPTFTVEN